MGPPSNAPYMPPRRLMSLRAIRARVSRRQIASSGIIDGFQRMQLNAVQHETDKFAPATEAKTQDLDNPTAHAQDSSQRTQLGLIDDIHRMKLDDTKTKTKVDGPGVAAANAHWQIDLRKLGSAFAQAHQELSTRAKYHKTQAAKAGRAHRLRARRHTDLVLNRIQAKLIEHDIYRPLPLVEGKPLPERNSRIFQSLYWLPARPCGDGIDGKLLVAALELEYELKKALAAHGLE